MADDWTNKLFFGDNLQILRDEIPNESVDLIYLDPPFNSKAIARLRAGTTSMGNITRITE